MNSCDGFGVSLSLDAYLNVLRVWSADELPGEIQAIMIMRTRSPPPCITNESLRTMVSLLALKGTCCYPTSSPLMHSFKANRLLLISAPSSLLCLLLLWQSAALSDPARSTNSNLPRARPFESLTWIVQIAWDRELVSLLAVAWVVRF